LSHSWFRVLYRAAAGSLLLLPALFLAPAQSHPSSGRETHHYNLADPALARRATLRLGPGRQGQSPELEKLVADDYVLFRASGKVTNKAGLIALVCNPHGYTNPYTVETPFVRDLGNTVILGGWVNLTGSGNGKPFQQKARFVDVWHKGPKGWQLAFTQVTLADHP
jgi:Domain of unknown function (DUF4440)